uniref:Uncharacterized protein n=1 Tax=Anguilla anguilla TaxID=7936 RepID=A0A0E9VL73_ANGAN
MFILSADGLKPQISSFTVFALWGSKEHRKLFFLFFIV